MNKKYFQLIIDIFSILNKAQKRKFILLGIFIFINGFVEVFGLALILPILYLINEPNKIIDNPTIFEIYKGLPFITTTNQFLTFLVLLLPLFFILKNIFSVCIAYLQNSFVNNTTVSLICSQYSKTLKKDYYYFNNTNSNFIIRDIATIPSEFASGVLIPTINFTSELIVTLFIISGLAVYNFYVFLIIITSIFPVTFIFYKLIKSKISRMGNEINEVRSKTFKTIFEAIYGIEEVKLKAKEEYFIKRSLGPLSYLHSIYTTLNTLKSIPNKIIETIAVLAIVLLYFIFNYHYEGDLSSLISTLIIFATAAYRLMPGINRMLVALIDIKNKSYVFKTLLIEEENNYYTKEIKNLTFNNNIEFENIKFRYEEEANIIDNFSLIINKGDKIGIIGESGSGKSTFLKILTGLIYPDTGTFFVDKQKISKINIALFRKKIGYVKQDFYLLDTTLAENIAFGESLKEIDLTKLNKVIKLSLLSDLVKSLDSGVNTNIGEFGANLSGGQKQRIAIARALYKEAEILIFDEATSALDDETETEVIETINNLSDNLTIIMVAHRKTSLRYCDKIYEIKKGQIFKKQFRNKN